MQDIWIWIAGKFVSTGYKLILANRFSLTPFNHFLVSSRFTDVKVVRSSASLLQAEALCKGDSQVTLLSLHDEVLQEIFSRLSYDEIARLRLVNIHLYILFQFCFILIVVGKPPR